MSILAFEWLQKPTLGVLAALLLPIVLTSQPRFTLRLGKWGWGYWMVLGWVFATTPLLVWDEVERPVQVTLATLCYVSLTLMSIACLVLPQAVNMRRFVWLWATVGKAEIDDFLDPAVQEPLFPHKREGEPGKGN